MPEQTKPLKTENSRMIDLFIALSGLLIVSYYYYGPRAIALAAVGIACSVGADLICSLLRFRRIRFELSSVITGFTLAMLMPASVSYAVLVFACFFAIAVGKHVFGGTGNYIFSPAAVGYAFAMLCWGKQVLLYPMPGVSIPLTGELGDTLSHSLAYMLNLHALPVLTDIDLWMGRFLGPMGATHVIILAVCAVFLMLRKTVSGITLITALGTASLLAIWFPRVNVSGSYSVLYELVSGIFLFGLLFLAGDSTTTPRSKTGRFWQGILLAVLTFAYRHFGVVENGFVFALLITNAMCDTLDGRIFRMLDVIKRKLREYERFRAARAVVENAGPGAPEQERGNDNAQ